MELIAREALRKDFIKRGFYPVFVKAALNHAPVIDAVEVVRCENCKYYHLFEEGFRDCRHSGGLNDAYPNDFCSYGERK